MKSFTSKLKELNASADNKIASLIESKGTESKFSNHLSLKITDDNCMFNLNGGRYLVEVRKENRWCDGVSLIDNEGYIYDRWVLSADEWFAVCDHLIKSYSKKRKTK